MHFAKLHEFLQWIFDLPDGGGRLLRIKEGHSEPPIKIMFYGNLGHNILSACKYDHQAFLKLFNRLDPNFMRSWGLVAANLFDSDRTVEQKLRRGQLQQKAVKETQENR